ncbi:MAG: zinc-ribbon domain containing protein [Eubacteriales bacterium]|nr:zinc-ribbon domain containing protein [Eubacteriales bacterium]
MSDKTLSCKDCGARFVFSESEQSFFAEKGYTNEPTRCPDCRAAKKQARGNDRGGYDRNGGGYQRTEREMFPAVCAACGKATTVPFKPSNDRPIFCRDCFQPRR